MTDRRRRLTPEDVHAIRTRFDDALQLAQQHGILCTGSPSQRICSEYALCGVVLMRQLFAVPCVDHIEEVLTAIFRKKHASVQTVSLSHLLDERGKDFQASAAYIRDRNQARGVWIPDR